MTKYFVVHGKNNEALRLEFSQRRLSWYKTIVQLWTDPNTKEQLNQYIHLCLNGTNQAYVAADKMKQVIDTLSKIGLLNKQPTKPHFFQSIIGCIQSQKYDYFNLSLRDPDFLRQCFFVNDHTDVIHLTDVHLIENHSKEGRSDRNLTEEFIAEFNESALDSSLDLPF